MRSRTRTIALVMAVVLALALLSACGSAPAAPAATAAPAAPDAPTAEPAVDAEKQIWKLNTLSSDDHPVTIALKEFEATVEGLLGDQVDVQIFTNGALGSSPDQILGGVLEGTIEFGEIVTGNAAEYTTALIPLDVPYLFMNVEQAVATMRDDELIAKLRAQAIQDSGLYLVGLLDTGFRSLSNSKRPINTWEDLKGMKIRTQSNKIHIEAFTKLGANVTAMSFGELFTGLQQGTIDGQENPLGIIYAYSFYEVNPYITLTEHVYALDGIFCSNEWFETLSPEFQDAIRQGIEAAREVSFVEVGAYNDESLQALIAAGAEVNELSLEEKTRAREIIVSSWNMAADICGQEYFDAVTAAVDAHQ